MVSEWTANPACAGSGPALAAVISCGAIGSTFDFGSEDRGSSPCRKTSICKVVNVAF